MRNLEQIITDLSKLQDAFDYLGEDEIHDQIYYQKEGIFSEYSLNETDENLLAELNILVDQLERYYIAITAGPSRVQDFNWIFG